MPLRKLGPIPWSDWSPDSDVEEWCHFLIGLVGDEEWDKRRAEIDRFIEDLGRSATVDDLHSRSWVPSDTAAWHLYACETWVRHPTAYPMAQGARHLPVVKSLMRDWPRLREIDGAEDRLTHGFMNERDHFDAALFELLVAVAYLRAGWRDVAFLPPERDRKSPDLRVVDKQGHRLLVECKRKARVSDYARGERHQWLRLFAPIREWMVDRRRAWVLECDFHVPLVGLPDDWLVRKTLQRLELATAGVVIDDADLTVTVREVNLAVVRAELREHGVRMDGSRFPTLLFGEFPPSSGVSPAVEYMPRRGMPHVADDVSWACAGIWSCDAPRAIEAKARHMRRDLAEAIDQIPPGELGAVHWGVDVYAGELVKREVYERTVATVAGFDLGSRAVEWVYAHIFEFLAPPEINFDVVEDVHYFGRAGNVTERLEPGLLIVPGNGAS